MIHRVSRLAGCGAGHPYRNCQHGFRREQSSFKYPAVKVAIQNYSEMSFFFNNLQ